MRRSAVARSIALSAPCVLGGCELDLFNVDLQLVIADAIGVNLDDDGVTLLHRAFDDVGGDNGGSEPRQRLRFPRAARVRFEVLVARDDGASLAVLGGGASPTLDAPEDGGSLAVPMLVAPVAVAGALSTVPSSLGGDACVTDDGQGAVYLTGGSDAQQGAYVLDDAFVVRGLAAGYPAGQGGVGCAATGGILAVAGSCEDGAPLVVMTTSATGERRQVTVNGALPACGAAAAPRADGDLWVIDGDNGVHIVDATGAVRASASLGIGARGDLAVTPKDGLVAIVGTNIHYVRDEAADLGPAVALGRRGSEVLVLDATGVISVVEDATLVPQRTVAGRDDVRSFALLDDDTAVLLLDGGEDIVVFDGAGVTRTIGTGVVGASHIAALPGGTLVIAGHAGDGVQVLSLVE